MNINLFAIRCLLTLGFVLSSLSINAQGHVSLAPQISSSDISVGDEFCIDFSLDNIELLGSIQFSLEYDESVLSFTDFNSPVLPGFTEDNFNASTEGFITVSYDTPIDEYPNGFSVDAELIVFQVCFEAIGETAYTSISTSDNPVEFEVSSNGNLRKVLDSSVSLDIIAEETDCPFDGIKLELEETCGSSGYNVCVDVFADDFEGVVSKQYSIVYDPSVLTFTNAGDFLLSNLFPNNIANPFPGFITVSWSSDDLINGTSLAGRQKIYEICFDIIEESTGSLSTYLSIGSTPTPMEAISNSLEELDIWRIDGKLDINIPDCANNGEPISSPSFNISDYEAVLGDLICIPVTVNDFSNILAFQYSISYDPSALTFVNTNLTGFPDLLDFNVSNPSEGIMSVAWTSNSDLVNGVTVDDNTAVFELCFDVIGSNGWYPIDFTSNPSPMEVVNTSGQLVSSDFNSGSVNITSQGSEFFTLELNDVSGEFGDVVCVDVTTVNFEHVLAMQFSINYDETALVFNGIEGINLPDLNLTNFGNPNPGDLTLSWFSSSDLINGATVTDGTTLFQVCFDVIGEEGVYPIEFSNSPAATEIIDALTATTISPQILLNGGVEIYDSPGEFSLEISSESVQQGETVCLDVTASNFEHIFAMQFSFNYNETALVFNGIEGVNLPDLIPANFGNPNPGELVLSWFSSSDLINGATVSDGTTIFQICFDVIGEEGIYPIVFANSPTSIVIVDALTSTAINPLNLINGELEIQDSTDAFTLEISTESAQEGDNICLDVTATNFENILGMQVSINYDATALVYSGTGSINLDGLTANSFFVTQPGSLTMSWFCSSDLINGATVSDGTAIFQLCFDVIGEEGTYPIEFSNSPISILIVDGLTSTAIDPLNLINGEVEIQDSIGGIGDFTLEISTESVQQGETVCLDVTASNFEHVLAMQFSVAYDETALVFNGIESINLPDLLLINFGNPNPGELVLSWFSNSDLINGATVSDGTTLFQLCFDVIGGEGVYPVEFSNFPTPIEVIDAITKLGINPINLINGEVEIEGDNANFKLDLSEGTAVIGELVCLDVHAFEFNNIVSMQYGIEYDHTVLAFNSINNVNLVNCSPSNILNPEPGVITTSWLSNDFSSGSTIADSTSLYQLCFDVIACTDFSAVNFSEDYLVSEISHDSGELIDYSFDNGGVHLGSLFGSETEFGIQSNGLNKLYQNKPNPTSGNTTVAFTLKEESMVEFNVFTENGLLVQTFSGVYKAGLNEIEILDLNKPGVYYYTISAGDFYQGKRLIVVSN